MTPAESTSPTPIARAAERVARRLDEVSQALVDRILDEVPVYRRLPEDSIADVRLLAEENSRVLTQALISGSGLDRGDLRYVSEHVRERVRLGVSLDEMLHAYRAGLTAFWELCIEEGVALGFSRDTALDLARRTSELSDALTTHAAESYVREESRLRELSDQAARDLMELLLRGEIDSESLAAHLSGANLHDAKELLVLVGRVPTTGAAGADALARASRTLFRTLTSQGTSALIAIRNGAVVGVVPADERRLISARLGGVHESLRESGVEFVCGVSAPRARLAALPAAFDEALLAVTRASADRPVVSLADLPVVENLMLGATGTMRGLLLAKADALGEDDIEALTTMSATLHAFAGANMNLSLAARRLHLHPNTLRYRLRRVRERTDMDPLRFAELVDLICLMDLRIEAHRVEVLQQR